MQGTSLDLEDPPDLRITVNQRPTGRPGRRRLLTSAGRHRRVRRPVTAGVLTVIVAASTAVAGQFAHKADPELDVALPQPRASVAEAWPRNHLRPPRRRSRRRAAPPTPAESPTPGRAPGQSTTPAESTVTPQPLKLAEDHDSGEEFVVARLSLAASPPSSGTAPGGAVRFRGATSTQATRRSGTSRRPRTTACGLPTRWSGPQDGRGGSRFATGTTPVELGRAVQRRSRPD